MTGLSTNRLNSPLRIIWHVFEFESRSLMCVGLRYESYECIHFRPNEGSIPSAYFLCIEIGPVGKKGDPYADNSTYRFIHWDIYYSCSNPLPKKGSYMTDQKWMRVG